MLGVVRYVKKVKASKDELARLDSVAHISKKAGVTEDLTPSASPHVLALLQPLPLFAIEPLSNTNRPGLESFSI